MSVLKIHTAATQLVDENSQVHNADGGLRFLGTTLNEGFLPGHKILKPIETDQLPDPEMTLMAAPTNRLVVGLTGVSCGGKTTMAKAFKNWLGDRFGEVIMQDDYYRPPSELPINEITQFPEFDEPESVRMDRIIQDVKAWKEADDVDGEPKVLVVEGTMIFTCLEIIELCDLRYLIHVDFQTAKFRRSLRNYKIPDPPQIMELNIWPKYIKHRYVAKHMASVNGHVFKQIDGTKTVEHILAGIIQDVAVCEHR